MLKALLAALLLAPTAARALPDLDIERFSVAAAVVGGRVYVVGGWTDAERENPTRSCRVFDGAWKSCPDAPQPIYSASAAELGGKLWIAGGWRNNAPDRAVLSFDPKTERWTSEPGIPSPAHSAAVVGLGGKLYVLGGEDRPGGASARVQAYDPAARRWTELRPMLAARKNFAAAAIGGKLYVAGGGDGKRVIKSAEVYDPASGRWTRLPDMPTARATMSYASDGRKFFVASGSDGVGPTAPLEAYDTAARRWLTLPAVPDPRDAGAGVYWRGCLMIVAGRTPTRGGEGRVLAFDPRKSAWVSECGSSEPVAAAPAVRRAARPDDFALIVGVQRYRALPDADHAEDDAQLMREKALALGVPEENVVTLLGERAGKADLEKYLDEWLPKNLTPKSRLYVFFSGHGAPEPADGTAFLVPWDGDAAFLRSTAYPVKKLIEKLGALDAREVLVALDACFSGTGGRSVVAKGLRPLVHVQDPASAGPGKVIVFTASAADEVSGSDDEKGHGLFTYYFARGLDGAADADKNGKLTVAELAGYVRAQVERSAHRQNREQHPQVRARDQSLRIY